MVYLGHLGIYAPAKGPTTLDLNYLIPWMSLIECNRLINERSSPTVEAPDLAIMVQGRREASSAAYGSNWCGKAETEWTTCLFAVVSKAFSEDSISAFQLP